MIFEANGIFPLCIYQKWRAELTLGLFIAFWLRKNDVTNIINFTTKYNLILKGNILMNWFIINQRDSPVIGLNQSSKLVFNHQSF